jgi:hypothetical protein
LVFKEVLSLNKLFISNRSNLTNNQILEILGEYSKTNKETFFIDTSKCVFVDFKNTNKKMIINFFYINKKKGFILKIRDRNNEEYKRLILSSSKSRIIYYYNEDNSIKYVFDKKGILKKISITNLDAKIVLFFNRKGIVKKKMFSTKTCSKSKFRRL